MNTITLKDQTVCYEGDASMLLCPMTTFLCSHRVPDGVSAAIRSWVESLDAANTCVVCGNLTADERFTLRLLVERGIPVVLVLAQAIPARLEELKLEAAERSAFNAGLLVVISPIEDATVTDVSSKTSATRNRLMIAVAERIVVGYMTENGNLASQLLGRHNVTVLKAGTQLNTVTDAQREQHNQTRMGWAIYRQLKEGAPDDVADDEMEDTAEDGVRIPWEHSEPGKAIVTPLPSLQMRQLLNQYLKLTAIERPSLLHSLVLFQVVRKYAKLPDFNFTAFLKLWGVENLRPEDWKASKVGQVWMPSLAERVMSRIFKALPSRFHQPVNPQEKFDAALAHALIDHALGMPGKKKERVLQRALSLAYHEHDNEAVARLRKEIEALKKG